MDDDESIKQSLPSYMHGIYDAIKASKNIPLLNELNELSVLTPSGVYDVLPIQFTDKAEIEPPFRPMFKNPNPARTTVVKAGRRFSQSAIQQAFGEVPPSTMIQPMIQPPTAIYGTWQDIELRRRQESMIFAALANQPEIQERAKELQNRVNNMLLSPKPKPVTWEERAEAGIIEANKKSSPYTGAKFAQEQSED